jgi:hypothetical protein
MEVSGTGGLSGEVTIEQGHQACRQRELYLKDPGTEVGPRKRTPAAFPLNIHGASQAGHSQLGDSLI